MVEFRIQVQVWMKWNLGQYNQRRIIYFESVISMKRHKLLHRKRTGSQSLAITPKITTIVVQGTLSGPVPIKNMLKW